jgi:hypothetical protein
VILFILLYIDDIRLRQLRAVLPLLSHYAIDHKSLFAALDRQKAANDQQIADRKRIKAQREKLRARAAAAAASSSSSDVKRLPAPTKKASVPEEEDEEEDEAGDADAWKAANFTADQSV